jgi:hypothetical protein
MWDFLYYLLVFALLAGAVVAIGLFARGYMTGSMGVMPLFGPRAERRLDVIEQANVDGRRRLLLIRRDDVEHLIMTGGPVDVVIETGIGQQRAQVAAFPEVTSAVYSRQPRKFGQVAAEQSSVG